MQITIEPAVPADAAAMLDFLRQIGGETDNLSFGPEGLPVTAAQEAAYLAQLEGSCDSLLLLAKADGNIIGNASLNRQPRRMCHRGEISVAVARSHWNKGIGSQLLEHLLTFAKENAFELLELQVRSDNLSAIHLYQKYGFEKLCTFPAFFKIENQYLDFDLMYLRLS